MLVGIVKLTNCKTTWLENINVDSPIDDAIDYNLILILYEWSITIFVRIRFRSLIWYKHNINSSIWVIRLKKKLYLIRVSSKTWTISRFVELDIDLLIYFLYWLSCNFSSNTVKHTHTHKSDFFLFVIIIDDHKEEIITNSKQMSLFSVRLRSFFFIINIDSDNVIVSFSCQCESHAQNERKLVFRISFFFLLASFIIIIIILFYAVNKYHRYRCIWSDAKITWAKQLKK